MSYTNIAVLLTCYNRREITLACLTSLYQQKLPQNIGFDVYLVDDGSTDGTGEIISHQFPDVNVIKGTGSLFWCGGMRLAWDVAAKGKYDAYLWLNDDTILLPKAIETLISTAIIINQKESIDCIIVGSCIDPKTMEHSYGGRLFRRLELIKPTDFPQRCQLINGNIVLIPETIFKLVGNISPEFSHTSGDNDYGLRAIKQGFDIWIAPGFQGLCSKNENNQQWADPNVPLRKRLKILHSAKGQPFYEIYIFARRHRGLFWPLDLIKLYLRVFFPMLYKQAKIFHQNFTIT